MLGWAQTHGLELLLVYIVFSALVGSMPVLSANAGYYSKWVYQFLHLLALNLRHVIETNKMGISFDRVSDSKGAIEVTMQKDKEV